MSLDGFDIYINLRIIYFVIGIFNLLITMEDDTNSVSINIPAARVCAKASNISIKPSNLKRIVKRLIDKPMDKPSDTILSMHTLLYNKPLRVSKLKRDELLLSYKLYVAKQKSGSHKQKLETNLKDNYKIINADLRKRVHVEHPCDDIRVVMDLDRGFYDYVNSHPVTNQASVFKSLKARISDQLRMRHEIGFRKDEILNIEVNIKNELKTYDITFKRLTEQANYFDCYILEDYKRSMALLKRWDELKVKVTMKICELENLASEQFTIMSRLMGLDYLYGLQQKYGRFLYYLSPPSWRARNRDFAHSVEIEVTGFDLSGNDEETFAVVFEKMQNECWSKLVSPVLYFSHPSELLDILNGIENQQLHHFTYVTHLAPCKKAINEELRAMKDFIIQDSTLLASTIKSYKSLVENCEEREIDLESKFYKILNGYFYHNVGTPEVLKLVLHLEFCYERVYSEKPANLNIMSMAKGLENFYMDYSKRLEALHSETIKKAVAVCLRNEQQKFRAAKTANRELQIFDRLEKNLLRAFAPPPKNKYDSEQFNKISPFKSRTKPKFQRFQTQNGNSDKIIHQQFKRI